MHIKEIRAEPVKESIEPALRFNVTLEHTRLLEVPLSAEGVLLAEDRRVLAPIRTYLPTIEPSKLIELGVRQGQQEQATTINVSFMVTLSNKALDHIESVRDKNPKRDVVLILKLKLRSLNTKAVLSSVKETGIDLSKVVVPEIRPKIEGYFHNAEVVCSQYDPDYRPSRTTMWIISGDGGPVFLNLYEREISESVTIPSSYWTYDFAPYLGLGRYFVVEVPELKAAELIGGGEFATRVNEAIHALAKIEKRILEGEWNEVMEDARPVHELLRHRTLIEDLLRRDGYTEEATEYFLNSIQNLFDCSSKFHHRIDQAGKKILPEIKASKEDAYLVYVTAAGLVNLLARKIKRYEESK